MRNTIKRPVSKGVAKVPVVMQMEALECGAACLAMVMAYYDKWVPLAQVRVDCGVSRDGSNAKNVLRAARSYGFVAQGYRCEPQVLQKEGGFPCIIHWNFNHFVVLKGFKKGKALLNDPARGECSVTLEEFDRSFTGICLKFEPGDAFVPEGKPKSVWAFAADRLKGTGPAIPFTAFSALIAVVANVIRPGFSRVFMDRLLTGKNPSWFYPFLIGLVFVSLIQILGSAINDIYSNKIHGKMAVVGSSTFLWKVLHMPMEFFAQRMTGDIQNRQDSNSYIAGNLVVTLGPLVLNLMLVIFYLMVMLRYSWVMTLVGVASVVVNLALARGISVRRVNMTRVQVRDAAKLDSATVAGVEMIETIKASGAENGYFEKWSGYQANMNTQTVKFTKANLYLTALPALVTTLTTIIVTMMGVYLTMNGNFTVGMIMAFQGFLVSFTTPANSLIVAGQTISEMRTAMERVEDVMQYPSDPCLDQKPTNTEGTSYAKLKGQIELKNVTFGYSRLAEPLIRNFNMTITPGSRVAIVGHSGCGKSTIAKLISGLYRPWSGEISFDGTPLREIDRNVFTGSVAVVDQDLVIFEDSISNNIKMWDKSIEDFEMILAARDAQIHNDIMQREGGYWYSLTEGGKDFSGGQRQRLEIARALAQDPSVIIMDEATSALDAKTERDVVNAITDRGITCIIIAHRLSTIRDCDEILVMDHGVVIERGTHQELFAKGGRYTELVTSD